MIWKASANMVYTAGNYSIYFDTRGDWTAYRNHPITCLGKGLTLKQAQSKCEFDAKAVEVLANEA